MVSVTARAISPEGAGRGLEILIEDDGQGIDPQQVETVLQRGSRADETVPGHGIGLSMADEIITLYGGHLEIASSRLGGALLCIRFGSSAQR